MSDKNKEEENEDKKTDKKFNPDDGKIDIKINSFGEIISNYSIDKLNEFLDENVEDKKFKEIGGKPERHLGEEDKEE